MKISGWFLTIVGVISMIIAGVCCLIFWYNFNNNCGDYLKLAGDAPSIEKAHHFLSKAVDHIERSHLTSGNSAYIFRTPENDVGIWYEQILGAKKTAESILERDQKSPNSLSQLERDNALMKIREVLLDDSKEGTTVTLPKNINWFPIQWLMLIWWIISSIFFIFGAFFLYVEYN